MSEVPTESIDEPDALGRRLTAAIGRLAERGPVGRLVLSASVPADAALVDALAEALDANPAMLELELVHPSAMSGFVASTLQLRLRRVTVRAHREIPTSQPPSPRRPAGRPSGSRPRTGIATLRQGYGRDDILRAIGRSRGAERVVLVFEDSSRPARELVQWLADGLAEATSVTELGLVHPSPAIGFLTSSLSLQVPGVRVLAARTLEDLDRAS